MHRWRAQLIVEKTHTKQRGLEWIKEDQQQHLTILFKIRHYHIKRECSRRWDIKIWRVIMIHLEVRGGVILINNITMPMINKRRRLSYIKMRIIINFPRLNKLSIKRMINLMTTNHSSRHLEAKNFHTQCIAVSLEVMKQERL